MNIGGIKVFIDMINESQKRILKLMGLNEEVSINSPSFEGLKIQKPTTQQLDGEFDVRDILQDDRNDMMRKQLFALFDVASIDDLMEIFDDVNPTKISAVLTKIKNDKTSKAQDTSKQRTITGANITSTNKDTPVVIYKTPGMYKVTLNVTNQNPI